MTRSDRAHCCLCAPLSQETLYRGLRGHRNRESAPWRLGNFIDGLGRPNTEGLLHPRPHATLHSRLEILDLESREVVSITLVMPEDAEPNKGRVSILSPLGQALKGRRKGQVTEAEFLGYRLPLVIMNVIQLDQEGTS